MRAHVHDEDVAWRWQRDARLLDVKEAVAGQVGIAMEDVADPARAHTHDVGHVTLKNRLHHDPRGDEHGDDCDPEPADPGVGRRSGVTARCGHVYSSRSSSTGLRRPRERAATTPDKPMPAKTRTASKASCWAGKVREAGGIVNSEPRICTNM